MESLKELYRGKEDVNKPVPKPLTGLFGIVAGAASVFGNTPLDVIKTRMQVCPPLCFHVLAVDLHFSVAFFSVSGHISYTPF